jgi:hypothetical protein
MEPSPLSCLRTEPASRLGLSVSIEAKVNAMSLILEHGRSPADWCAEFAAKGLPMSERTLRAKARELGACHVLGKAMIITPDQIDRILEDTCSPRISEAKPGGSRAASKYNGRPVSAYVRESTGSSTESGARDWIRLREEQEERRFYIGDEGEQITFMGAVLLYNPTADMGKYLEPLLRELGHYPCAKITPKMIRDLGAKLYPKNCTDSWRRWVVTPARAVINNAHELGKMPAYQDQGL